MSDLQVTLSHGSMSVGVQIPLSPIEDWWNGLKERNARARDAEDNQVIIKHWIMCPGCHADASHLGSVHMDDRMVRICTRCQSLFEVADGSS